MRIYQTNYKDQRAIALESEKARFLFLPDTGASMASAYSKPMNKEYLVQRAEPAYRRQPFGGSYVEAECCGMDDMFPTIDSCLYEHFPWTGTVLADHGEVWNQPCRYEIKDTEVHFTCYGVRLPYIFHKRVSMLADDVLHVRYRVDNPMPFKMDFLWAGHTMVVAEPGLQLHVPAECTQGVAIFSNTGRIGEYGNRFSYPVLTDKQGVKRDVSRMTERSGNCEKYYFANKLSQGWCAVSYPAGDIFSLSFSADTVPYLGILHNEGDFHGLYNIFLEPCTSAFDRPDVARLFGQNTAIPAEGCYEWSLAVSIGQRNLSDAILTL